MRSYGLDDLGLPQTNRLAAQRPRRCRVGLRSSGVPTSCPVCHGGALRGGASSERARDTTPRADVPMCLGYVGGLTGRGLRKELSPRGEPRVPAEAQVRLRRCADRVVPASPRRFLCRSRPTATLLQRKAWTTRRIRCRVLRVTPEKTRRNRPLARWLLRAQPKPATGFRTTDGDLFRSAPPPSELG